MQRHTSIMILWTRAHQTDSEIKRYRDDIHGSVQSKIRQNKRVCVKESRRGREIERRITYPWDIHTDSGLRSRTWANPGAHQSYRSQCNATLTNECYIASLSSITTTAIQRLQRGRDGQRRGSCDKCVSKTFQRILWRRVELNIIRSIPWTPICRTSGDHCRRRPIISAQQ